MTYRPNAPGSLSCIASHVLMLGVTVVSMLEAYKVKPYEIIMRPDGSIKKVCRECEAAVLEQLKEAEALEAIPSTEPLGHVVDTATDE